MAQEAVRSPQIFTEGPLLAVQAAHGRTPRRQTHAPGQGAETGLQGQAGLRHLQGAH